jgi:hypothetical protein
VGADGKKRYGYLPNSYTMPRKRRKAAGIGNGALARKGLHKIQGIGPGFVPDTLVSDHLKRRWAIHLTQVDPISSISLWRTIRSQ